MDFFIHKHAICESQHVGRDTKIWAFSHVLPRAKIGRNCNICDHVFVENDVVVGDNVTVKSGVQLWDGVRLEDNVFIGPNVTFTNDKFPRSKQYPTTFLQTVIKKNASIGANATLLPGIVIGENAMVGAGAVVTRSVPANAIVAGNPSKIVSYVGLDQSKRIEKETVLLDKQINEKQSLSGATVYPIQCVQDLRGDLSFGEFNKELPFIPKRYFLVYNVENDKIRGEHAHRKCHQFLTCVSGKCSLVLDNGKTRSEVLLDSPKIGVYIPPMVWGMQYKYSHDAVLLVFASEYYEEKDYIRDYEVFLKELSAKVC